MRKDLRCPKTQLYDNKMFTFCHDMRRTFFMWMNSYPHPCTKTKQVLRITPFLMSAEIY